MDIEIKNLYVYVMTANTGFSPNYGTDKNRICTLACCKGGRNGIRHTIYTRCERELKNKNTPINNENIKNILKELKIWILGLAGKSISNNNIKYLAPIYMMQINEILSFEEYYESPKYQFKKYDKWNKSGLYGYFDNYYTNDDEEYQYKRLRNGSEESMNFQHLNDNLKSEDNLKRDLNGKYVLCSSNYYYINGKNYTNEYIDIFKKIKIGDNSCRGFRNCSLRSERDRNVIYDFFQNKLRKDYKRYYQNIYSDNKYLL